jgi:hypothetical protein
MARVSHWPVECRRIDNAISLVDFFVALDRSFRTGVGSAHFARRRRDGTIKGTISREATEAGQFAVFDHGEATITMLGFVSAWSTRTVRNFVCK